MGDKEKKINRLIMGLLGGSILAQIFSLALLPFVARIYSPEQLSILYIIGNIIVFVTPVVMLRLDQAYIAAGKIFKPFILVCAIYIILVFSSISAVIFGFYYFKEKGGLWYFITFGAIAFAGLYQLFRQVALADTEVKKISISMSSKVLSKYVLLIIFGYYSTNKVLIASAEIISTIVAFLMLLVPLASRSIIVVPFATCKKIVKRYKNFTLKDLNSTIVNSILIAINIPIISYMYGLQYVGLFGMAMQIVSLPNYHAGKAVSDGFFVVGVDCLKMGKIKELKIIYRNSMIKLVAVSAVVYSAIIILSELLINNVFDEKWFDSVEIIKMLAVWMAFSLMASPSMRLFVMMRRSSIKLYIDAFVLIALMLYAAYANILKFNFEDFLYGLVVLRSLGYCIQMVAARIILRKTV